MQKEVNKNNNRNKNRKHKIKKFNKPKVDSLKILTRSKIINYHIRNEKLDKISRYNFHQKCNGKI